MHIITEKRLREFAVVHPEADSALRLWAKLTRKGQWTSLVDARKDWGSADLVDKLIPFNIGGNKYRLVTHIDYAAGLVFIRSILTHGVVEE
jgi:mRNA interferase HigB